VLTSLAVAVVRDRHCARRRARYYNSDSNRVARGEADAGENVRVVRESLVPSVVRHLAGGRDSEVNASLQGSGAAGITVDTDRGRG
jgi:hypothetical protein